MPHVLVVDDDDFTLRLCSRQLASAGFPDATVASGARAALDLVAAQPEAFDVLLFDLQMPDIDGIELVRKLAEAHFGGVVAMMSGTDPRLLQSVARLAGEHGLRVGGTLRKPFSMEELRLLMLKPVLEPDNIADAKPRIYSPANLAAAIAQGQIVAAYQPQVAVADGRVVGVEALARWHHPRDGLVRPASFVPMAEANGLIGPLTDAMLRCVLHDATTMCSVSDASRFSVNVSPLTLGDPAFPDRLADAVRAAGLAPSRLTIEITESMLANDERRALEILARLRLRQFGLSLDDFGQGYSTLARLRDVPFDEIKIDRAFVHGAASDASVRTIFQALIAMGRDLGLRVVAEGVEDDDDWRFVRTQGCEVAQGYAIARPMEAPALRRWMAARVRATANAL